MSRIRDYDPARDAPGLRACFVELQEYERTLDPTLLPTRLRMLVWLSGGRIRWRTIKRILDAGYVDGFRHLNQEIPGFTFPVWNPHLRLDYAFVPSGFADRVRQCTVIASEDAKRASDHFPLLVEA